MAASYRSSPRTCPPHGSPPPARLSGRTAQADYRFAIAPTTDSLPSPETPLQGGCLCEAVRFEITAPFVSAGYCHCTHCQRRTGTGSSANGRVPQAGFRLLAGEEQLRSFQPPVGVPKLFCGACGSALFSGDPFADREVAVRLGTLDRDPGIRPQFRQFVDSSAPWEPIPEDGLARHPRSRGT
ncbi:MAG: GFA family protein [Solirubrobacteraceae bacterium]